MTARALFLFLLVVVFSGCTHAQIIELKGGDSTLFDAAGGNVIFHFPNSTESFDAGIAAGHLHLGVDASFDWHQWNWTLGDDYLSPTIGIGLVVPLRGVTAVRRWEKQKLTLFTGAAGQLYSFPYFSATSVDHFGLGIFYQNKLPHGLEVYTMGVVLGSQRTAIGGAHYLWKGLDASGAAGLLQSQPFGNGRISYKPIPSLFFFATRQDYFFDMRQTYSGSSLIASLYISTASLIFPENFKMLPRLHLISALSGLRLAALSKKSSAEDSSLD
jgi:hypothetical protein